jgi:hypothetical protein
MRAGLLGFLVLGLAVVGCGGDDDKADAAPLGACTGTYSQAFPSEDDAQFCMFPWGTDKPELELTLCEDISENCKPCDGDCATTDTTPDFSCLADPPMGPATPATVTMTGFVDVFSSGPNSDGARIQVFRESQLDGVDDITTVTPIATFDVVLDAATLADARACPVERDLEGDPDFEQGKCSLPDDTCTGQCDKILDAVEFCHKTTCDDLSRWEVRYTIPSVPTNEFLVIRSVGLDTDGNPQVLNNTWSPLIQYNVFLSTADKACADESDTDCIDTSVDPALYRSDANLLSSQDYLTIPTSAGLSAGITPGNGGIAGEIHDCNSIRLGNAQVGFTADRVPRVIVFFNGNPVKTLPSLQQVTKGTNSLSLYAGLDVAPGPIDVVSVGVKDAALFEANRFTARIWPDSITLVRLGGGRPPQ